MAPSGVIAVASDTGPCLGPCGNPVTVSIYGQIRLVTATSLLLLPAVLGVRDSLHGWARGV